jgi:hypothetical protein
MKYLARIKKIRNSRRIVDGKSIGNLEGPTRIK